MEILKQCQFLLSNSTKMKRFWLEKSCCNIISCSQIRKLSIQDLVSKVGNKNELIEGLSDLSNNFADLLFDPIIFKVMLMLLLTSPVSDSRVSKFTNLRDFYLHTLYRRLCCFYRKGRRQAGAALKFLINATRSYHLLSHSMNDLLR